MGVISMFSTSSRWNKFDPERCFPSRRLGRFCWFLGTYTILQHLAKKIQRKYFSFKQYHPNLLLGHRNSGESQLTSKFHHSFYATSKTTNPSWRQRKVFTSGEIGPFLGEDLSHVNLGMSGRATIATNVTRQIYPKDFAHIILLPKSAVKITTTWHLFLTKKI